MALYINCAERTRGTQIFADPASDTPFGIDSRYFKRSVVAWNRRNHAYGAGRAMSCAVAAFYALGFGKAVFRNPYRMPYLYR